MPGSTPSRSSRNCYVSLIPMSERQQLKLVRQLETCDSQGANPASVKESSPHRPRSRSCNGRGETPLHKAAIKGDEELVIKLLEEGADPNIPDFAGWTPLHEACNHGWYGIALALVQAGANVNARGFDDDTPLHDAAINGHSKLVRLLVESGADVYSRNKGGKTPCDVAAPGLMPHLLKSHSSENVELGRKKSDVSSGSAQADNTAISEMRRTPPQTKVEKSPRVTLRLHHIKKKSGKLNSEGTAYDNNKFQFSVNMEEKSGNKEDVYEFKSSKEATPVRGNSTSPEVDNKNNPDSKPDKTGENLPESNDSSSPAKRPISEVTDNDENEDDSKKKKRKESDGKDVSSSKTVTAAGRLAAVRNVNSNSEKTGKAGGHVVNKGAGVASKTVLSGANPVSNDRKSPTSPKGTAAGANPNAPGSNNPKTDTEEDKLSQDGEKVDPGPKVPPLKIVIPQSSVQEPEQGNRNGKNSASRHHQALPYVVSSNSNDSEKDGPRSRSVSPTDSLKSDEKKDPAIGMLSAEDQKGSLHHQRVLRSSHRSGPGSNGESRSSDSVPAAKNNNNNNNGNGQGSNSNSGTTAAVVTSSNTNPSNSSTTASVDNPSPQNSNQSSPTPQSESNPSSNTNPPPAASENPSNGSNSSNYRGSNVVSNNKQGSNAPSSASSNSSGNNSEEKTAENNSESAATSPQQQTSNPAPVELHPRKRKLKHNKEVKEPPPAQVTSEANESANTSTEIHPHDQPVKNCYQLFLDIRKQIERRRKGLFPVQPKPPQGFKDYLMNRCTYVLAGNASTRQIPSSPVPPNITPAIKELFTEQEKERHRLRLQHVIEKEKLVLSVEQEILRVHGRAARALANQSLPFSVCTILKDEEVYNLITPEQEEKDRNARSRYNGRLFLSWLQDVDDKWEKIKEAMLLRHHNEAESLHAVQKMDWEWKMKELGLCEFKSTPVILDSHVPMVHVSDDFDLLPA